MYSFRVSHGCFSARLHSIKAALDSTSAEVGSRGLQQKAKVESKTALYGSAMTLSIAMGPGTGTSTGGVPEVGSRLWTLRALLGRTDADSNKFAPLQNFGVFGIQYPKKNIV